MRWLIIVVLILFWGVLLYAESDLPDYGDAQAPASLHVSPYYIEKSLQETDTPNMVTAVLADYRGYDTLGETTVIFTAGLACMLLLMRSKSREI